MDFSKTSNIDLTKIHLTFVHGKKGFCPKVEMELQKLKKIITSYLQNRYHDTINVPRRLGKAQILAGDDLTPYSDNLTACSNFFYDSGF